MIKNAHPFSLLFLISFSFNVVIAGGGPKPVSAPQISRPGVYQGYSEPEYRGFDYTSCYVSMRDSVQLAADVFLPKNLQKGKKVPTILALTRYVRSVKAKFPFSVFIDPILTVVSKDEVDFFTSYGYAYVVVDVRGTGASGGDRRMEFSPEEIADGNDIVNWIISQQWSDSLVGSTGVSYLGTTAEMLLANQHPNVKACIPRSAIFDLYDNILFPGGVCQGPFVDVWGLTTQSLDNNNFKPLSDKAAFVEGIHYVKGDRRRKVLHTNIKKHKHNYDVTKGLKDILFRNDIQKGVNAAPDDFSVHSHKQEIQNSGTAIYRIGGWYDGALAKGAINAFLNTTNTKKVLIGPWDHGPQNNVSPFAISKKVEFDIHLEMLRFFDYYLKGIDNGIENEPVFTYYTIGEETWNTTNTWPLRANEGKQFYFNVSNQALTENKLQLNNDSLAYKVDYTATSGNTSRWNSVTTLYMSGPTNYNDRQEEDRKLQTFTSSPLETSMEMTGNPVMHIEFSADANDATVFCYLEDVAPDGSVTYVTEGMFRPLQRKVNDNALYKTPYPDHTYRKEDAVEYHNGDAVELTFDLLPISYLFKKGHQIRISIAGSDAGHFNLPAEKPDTFMFYSNSVKPSYVSLPIASY